MAEKTLAAPEISIVMAIEPSSFPPNSSDQPTISITATSHASRPVTIFIWPTILNLGYAQRLFDFSCIDLTTNTPLAVGISSGIQRREFSRARGSSDAEFFHTLKPGKPLKFEHSFALAKRYGYLTEGHRYRFAIEKGDVIRHWWYGTRSDILVWSKGTVGLLTSSGPPITLGTADSVEFEVEEFDEALLEKPPEEPAVMGSLRGRCVASVM